jgi:hypothetical protein
MIEERSLYSEWPQKNAKIANRERKRRVFLTGFFTQRFNKAAEGSAIRSPRPAGARESVPPCPL